MARKKISEFKAKQLMYPLLGIESNYFAVILNNESKLSLLRRDGACLVFTDVLNPNSKYVLKVDQGVKGRMKKGLIKIELGKNIKKAVEDLQTLGYKQFFLEEYFPHEQKDEKFLSLERQREGIQIMYSEKGGIHIEENKNEIKKLIIKNYAKESVEITGLDKVILEKLMQGFKDYHFSFLEINPLIMDAGIHCLDMAVEVDSAGEFFVKDAWNSSDFVESSQSLTPEEVAINTLSKQSSSSFSFEILNPNGSFFLLLSGGGASVVLADELFNQGKAAELANYGEYSGNPSREETKIYAQNIISFMLKSKAKHKRLIIGGGIANFTDVRITFSGIVDALEEYKKDLKKQNISIYVRRGGPHEKEGRELLERFMKKEGVPGVVLPATKEMLTEVIHKAL